MDKTVRLDIVEIETNKVVESIDVSGQSDRGVERILSGLLHQMNTDDYVVDEVTDEDEVNTEAVNDR